MKINKEDFRHYVRYFLCLLGMQFVVYILRSWFLGTMINQAVYDSRYNGNTVAHTMTVWISVICVIWFCIMVAIIKGRDIEAKRIYRAEVKDNQVTLVSILKRCWKTNLVHTALFAAVQIPFLIFYSCFGYSYDYTTFFELLNSWFVGFYEITHIGIIGFIMACAFLFLVSMVLEVVVYRSWNSNRVD